MEIKLLRNVTIRELKKVFAKKFPFLKLEFFKEPHQAAEGSGNRLKISEQSFLSEISSMRKEGVFSFKPSVTVAEFEQGIQKEFGLPVQVFRRSGDVWIETIQTDDVSLAKQNSMGETSSKPIRFNINALML